MTELILTVTLIACWHFFPTGLLRDVDAGCMGYTRGFQNLFRSGTICVVSSGAGHFRSNLQRDSRASFRRDFAVLPHCLGTGGARGKKFLKIFFGRIQQTRDSTIFPRSQTSAFAMAFSSVEKEVPNRVTIFCLIKKVGRCKISLSDWKVTMERSWLQKWGEKLVLSFV